MSDTTELVKITYKNHGWETAGNKFLIQFYQLFMKKTNKLKGD